MNRSVALGRKIIYLVVLVAMLLPLYLLGQPAGGGSDRGGALSEMRVEYNIAESDLGEISPASETMKLASLGLRGVAATLLWNRSHDYKVMHEWDRLKATLNQIALLQPHFDKVWEFQAHNLAYNVSTEFDDYRQRYEMVREGTEYLTRGVRQNRNAPRLIWYTGWFYGSKMGMSDEKIQFRRLFADDEVLHEALLKEGIAVDSPEARGPLGKPDNWLVGRLWLNHGYDLVDSGVKIRRQTPLNFYETGPKWRMKHAEAIEKEGILDDRAQSAWTFASEDWSAFGNRSIPTTAAFTIKLDQLDDLVQKKAELVARMRELTGDVYAEAEQALLDALQPAQQALLKKPEAELTLEDRANLESLRAYLIPNFDDVAAKAGPSVRLDCLSIIAELKDVEERTIKTNGYRNQINYPYWKTLAQAEQEERTVEARRLIFEAEQANSEAELDKAIELYEKAFTIWSDIFDDYPILTVDDSAQDLFESIRRYMIAIDSEELPDNFALATFVDMMGMDGQVDSQAYEQVRLDQKAKAEARRKELAEEERLREEAAKAAEMKAAAEKAEAEKMAAEKAATEKAAAEKAAAEKMAAEKAEAEKKAAMAKAEEEKAAKAKAEAEKAEKEKAEMEKAAKEKAEAEKAAGEKAEAEKAAAEKAADSNNPEMKKTDEPKDGEAKPKTSEEPKPADQPKPTEPAPAPKPTPEPSGNESLNL